MPRIYAKNPEHNNNWAATVFENGASAIAADADASYFSERSSDYTVDTSKDTLELWDTMTVAQLDKFYEWLGGTPSSSDTKYQKVRKIETSLSAKLLGSLTVSSEAATTTDGTTKLTVTSPGEYDYWFKSAETTAPSILYGDIPSETNGWQKLTLSTGVADNVEPNAATDDKFTVVSVGSAGTVIAGTTGDLTLKS